MSLYANDYGGGRYGGTPPLERVGENRRFEPRERLFPKNGKRVSKIDFGSF